jgi:toxin ParE1/3/4
VGKFLLSREALEDLDLVWTYIARDNAEAAERVLDAAYRTCKNLADYPELGRLREIPNIPARNLRSFAITDFPNYIIFYRVLPGTVQIVRVLHGARNIDGLF